MAPIAAWYNVAMKANFSPKRIVWVDLEMTGLDPVKDEILEVAAIITDWDLTPLATYEGVVRHDPAKLGQLLDANAAFWDANPEARRGLEQQNNTGQPLGEVEQQLLAFCQEHCPEDSTWLLAGNSIHQDRRFIDHWWPAFAARLHYRMLDVSAWKVVFDGKYGKRFAKPEEHRALDDIRGSIMELKYYLSKVQPGKKS